MSEMQLLRLLVNERLAAAAEEIFGLVERTIEEYQDEAVRSNREVIQLRQQIEQLTVLKPEVVLFRADTQLASEKLPPSLQQYDNKMEETPSLNETEFQKHPQVKEEQVDQYISPDDEADTSEDADLCREINQLKQQIEQLTALKCEGTLFRAAHHSIKHLRPSLSPSAAESIIHTFITSRTDYCNSIPYDTWAVSEEIMPSQQPNQLPTVEENETYDSQQVREEQVDQCISPDMEADTPNVTEVRYPTSEPTINCELLPSSMDVTVSLNKSVDNSWNQREISPWPPQHHSVALFIGLEQPPRGERSCRFCGKHFTRDSYLIRHVDTSHNGHKAFKCLECNKEFEQRYYLVMHTRIHTGEKPFSCDYCDRTFSQNSSRLVHMRRHTGEKPYFCNKCGKSFAQSNHLRICKTRSECNITPEEMNISEDHKDRNAFKCSECNKEFKMRQQLVLHMRVHTGEKPYSCDFCGKSFTQSSNCIVHMRKHTGEKPYFCQKCGRSYTYSQHKKYCKGTQNESTNKSVRCTTCGKDLHTESNLKLHMEVHKSWRRHIVEKRQGQE